MSQFGFRVDRSQFAPGIIDLHLPINTLYGHPSISTVAHQNRIICTDCHSEIVPGIRLTKSKMSGFYLVLARITAIHQEIG